MSRRSAAEAATRLASLKNNRIKISKCPLCEQTIYANQATVWGMVDDQPARTHKECPQ